MVFTNDRCVGCNKCIRTCPVLTANVAENGRIDVDESMCIQCGACFDNCHHGARDFEDDTQAFLADLRAGKQLSIIVAPAFIANYPKTYKKIYGYLKSLGVAHIYSVSFGADITTWTYISYASIEAARAGESGRGFAVVAGEIRNLANSTKDLIEANDKKAADTVPRINESVEVIKTLLESISVLSERVANIAATTEEISAQSETIRSLSNDIQEAVKEI